MGRLDQRFDLSTGWEVTIPGFRFESLNRTMRQHWAVQRKNRMKVWDMVQFHIGPIYPKFEGRVQLGITRQWGTRMRAMDPDNLVAACKALIDCLKSPKGRSRYGLGIIPDDDPSHIELVVKQEKAKDGIPKAFIQIQPIE